MSSNHKNPSAKVKTKLLTLSFIASMTVPNSHPASFNFLNTRYTAPIANTNGINGAAAAINAPAIVANGASDAVIPNVCNA